MTIPEPPLAPTPCLLPVAPDAVTPHSSLVRLLARLPGDNMTHFELGARETSIAQRHRTMSEMWCVLSGLGRMWRQSGDDEPGGISGVSGGSVRARPRGRRKSPPPPPPEAPGRGPDGCSARRSLGSVT